MRRRLPSQGSKGASRRDRLTAAPAVSVRRTSGMSFYDSVTLFSELALGLAGFAGVASAFSGRERSFQPAERLRLMGLMVLSGIVLAGCLIYVTLSMAEVSDSVARQATAIVCALASAVVAATMLPDVWRHSQDADATVVRWSFYLATTLVCGSLVLYATAAIFGGVAWMIAMGFTIQLFHGLWMFVLLLTRKN